MKDNINKVAERGERLDSLESKTDTLASSAQGFRRGANRVRKQMWWKVYILPYSNLLFTPFSLFSIFLVDKDRLIISIRI